MVNEGREPIGITLVRRKLVGEQEINQALEYQKEKPETKIVEIIHELGLCN